jgi:hypothetical protein
MKKKKATRSKRAKSAAAVGKRDKRRTKRSPTTTATTKRSAKVEPRASSGAKQRLARPARVSFDRPPNYLPSELRQVVRKIVRDEVRTAAQWLAEQNRLLLELFFGHTISLPKSHVANALQSAGVRVGPDVTDAGLPDTAAPKNEATAVDPEPSAESPTTALEDYEYHIYDVARKLDDHAKSFRKYRLTHYLLVMYKMNAVVGTNTVFHQADTGWRNNRALRTITRLLMGYKLIQGFGEPIYTDPKLLEQKEREAPFRFQGYQLTQMGVAVLKAWLPWAGGVNIDLSTKPIAIPEHLGRKVDFRAAWE